MQKLPALLLCFVVLTSACKSEPVELGMPLEENLEEVIEEEVPVEELLPEVHFEPGRESTVASSDYTLVDNTGYGFAYDASNVFDQDFSTAWCQSEIDPEVDGIYAGGITLTFAESPAGKTVGIVPGFARDETIYFQNNRIKQLVLSNGPSPILEDNIIFNLEDSYGMQFFQLPEGVGESLKFYVSDVYPGSKYDDTCIAEMDLWSDYVGNQDAEAALDYYQNYKEDSAQRPVGIADLDMIFAHDYYNISKDDVTTACGAIDTTYITKSKGSDGSFTYLWKDNGDGVIMSDLDSTESLGSYDPSPGAADWNAYGGMTPVLSAKLNEWAKENDSFELKWIQTGMVMKLPEPVLVEMDTVQAKTCADGSLYISDALEGDGFSLVGSFILEVYYQGRLVGRTEISQAQ